MTTPVRIQQRIRQLEGQGLNHTRIARELGVRTTVIKYVSRDYSPSPREGAVGSRSLVTGEYARAADEWGNPMYEEITPDEFELRVREWRGGAEHTDARRDPEGFEFEYRYFS